MGTPFTTKNPLLSGLVLGAAVGDSIGLPFEGLPPARIARLLPGPLRHRFLFDRGMVSDDTDHAYLTGRALLAEPKDPEAFGRRLSRQLRWWLAAAPAGVGLATAKAIVRLWLGFPSSKSGVRSAGNGPAMRAPIIGAFFANDPKRMTDFVRASTRITHTDPRAEVGALAVAMAASAAARGPVDPGAVLAQLCAIDADADWRSLVDRIRDALAAAIPVSDFAAGLGLSRGVTGFIYHSVPVALFAWLRHLGDFRATIEAVVRCGGDTDTVAAIAGGLAGAIVGPEGIPPEWVDGLRDYPCSVSNLRWLAQALGGEVVPAPWPWVALPPRNAVFLAAVLAHAFRRMLPPY